MTNLNNFAELMRAAKAEKQEREFREAERKLTVVAPNLSELFEVVKKAKEVAQEDVTEKREKVLELVKGLEDQVKGVQTAPEQSTDDETVLPKGVVADNLEKRVIQVIKQLQKDFNTLKQYVESNRTASFGGGGSGEVRITRMDDVHGVPVDGKTLVWSESIGKFIYTTLPIGGVNEEEMPYSKRVDFVTDDVLYKGEAEVGSLETDPVWRIRKVTIYPDGDVTEVWANGTATFSHEWGDRALYSYS